MLSFSGGQRVGQRTGLSTTDVDKLWTVYQSYSGQVGQCSHARGLDSCTLATLLLLGQILESKCLCLVQAIKEITDDSSNENIIRMARSRTMFELQPLEGRKFKFSHFLGGPPHPHL